jgi:hypothetical protein
MALPGRQLLYAPGDKVIVIDSDFDLSMESSEDSDIVFLPDYRFPDELDDDDNGQEKQGLVSDSSDSGTLCADSEGPASSGRNKPERWHNDTINIYLLSQPSKLPRPTEEKLTFPRCSKRRSPQHDLLVRAELQRPASEAETETRSMLSISVAPVRFLVDLL